MSPRKTVRAAASERYALIITGALGEPTYEEQYAQWRQQAVTALIEKLALDEKYPLTSALHDKIHPTQQAKVLKSGKKSGASATYEAPGVFVRTQIVSPQLCGT